MLQGLAFQHEEHLCYDVCSSTQASHTYPTDKKQTMLSFTNIYNPTNIVKSIFMVHVGLNF